MIIMKNKKLYEIHFVLSVNGETVTDQREKGESFNAAIANVKEIIRLYEAEK